MKKSIELKKEQSAELLAKLIESVNTVLTDGRRSQGRDGIELVDPTAADWKFALELSAALESRMQAEDFGNTFDQIAKENQPPLKINHAEDANEATA